MYDFECLTDDTLEKYTDSTCAPEESGCCNPECNCDPGDEGTCNPYWPCNPDMCNPGP